MLAPCRSCRAPTACRARTRRRCSLLGRGPSASASWSSRPPDRARSTWRDLDLRFAGHRRLLRLRPARSPPSSRRPRISADLLAALAPRPRAGSSPGPSAAKVALIMLCGLARPIDLATTSWTPSASKIARIGPPAMMPVPGGRRAHDHPAGAVVADDVVMQRAALAQRHADHAALGLLGRLADRLGHLARLAGCRSRPGPCRRRRRRAPQKPNRRPPFTTLATRLMLTSFSTNSLRRVARSSPSRPSPSALLACHACLPRSSELPGRPRGRRRPGP